MLPPSGGIFDYDRKIVEIQDEERITQQADFWNKPNPEKSQSVLFDLINYGLSSENLQMID